MRAWTVKAEPATKAVAPVRFRGSTAPTELDSSDDLDVEAAEASAASAAPSSSKGSGEDGLPASRTPPARRTDCDIAGPLRKRRLADVALHRRDAASSVASSVASKPGEKRKWDPNNHFTNQVAMIRRYIPAPHKWNIFLGSLGTGVVGVRPSPREHKMPKVKSDVKSSEGSCGSGTDSAVSDLLLEAGYVILFLNARAAKLQEWGGRTLAGFSPVLNRDQRTLLWQSQRSDRHGRLIARIRSHVESGSKLVVAVRSTASDKYNVLGTVADFRLESEAQFLVAPGDHLIHEQGTRRVHKSILAQCLDAGLKSGVGLAPVLYPLSKRWGTPIYCACCCWAPSTALVTFSDINPQVADKFDRSNVRNPHGPQNSDSCGNSNGSSSGEKNPRRRLHGKQPEYLAKYEPASSDAADNQQPAAVSSGGARRRSSMRFARRRWRKLVLLPEAELNENTGSKSSPYKGT